MIERFRRLVRRTTAAVEDRLLAYVVEREILIQRIRALGRNTKLETILDQKLTRLFNRLGIPPEAIGSLERAVGQHVGLAPEAFDVLPMANATLSIHAEAALDAWAAEGGDLTALHRGYYDEDGDAVRAATRLVEGTRITPQFGLIGRYGGAPLYVRFWFDEHAVQFEVKAHAAEGPRFLEELERRIDALLTARYRGKAIDIDLAAVEVKAPAVEDLVYPERLQREVAALLASVGHWFRSDRVRRWGYLLIGPPGSGKTTVGGLVARERPAGSTYLYCPAADLETRGKYEAPATVRRAFRYARIFAPTIIHIDDVDIIAGNRGSDSSNTMVALLEALDGLREDAKVFVLMTTNDPTRIDRAIIERPGRVHDKVTFEGFEVCAGELLKRYAARCGLDVPDGAIDAVTADPSSLAGFTPDEAKNIGERLAIRYGGKPVTTELLRTAFTETRTMFGDRASGLDAPPPSDRHTDDDPEHPDDE